VGRRSSTKKAQLPSLAWFARQPDPFQDLSQITARLKLETSESRHLEWKSTPPIGPTVALRTKYRVVKAVVSFANTEGGFVLFGIDPKGRWLGFTEAELRETDLAALAELINGCISPELIGLNDAQITSAGHIYPVTVSLIFTSNHLTTMAPNVLHVIRLS